MKRDVMRFKISLYPNVDYLRRDLLPLGILSHTRSIFENSRSIDFPIFSILSPGLTKF